MAGLTVSEKLKSRVEAQASAEGFASAEEYLQAVLDDRQFGGPPELTVGSDEELKAVVDQRLDGPWVEADASDFARIRAKFIEQWAGRQAGRELSCSTACRR